MTQTAEVYNVAESLSVINDVSNYLRIAEKNALKGDIGGMEWGLDHALYYSSANLESEAESIRRIGRDNASLNYLNSAKLKASNGLILTTYDDAIKAIRYARRDITSELEDIKKTCVKNANIKKKVKRLFEIAENQAAWGHDEKMKKALEYAVGISEFYKNKNVKKKARKIVKELNTRVNPNLMYKSLSQLEEIFV